MAAPAAEITRRERDLARTLVELAGDQPGEVDAPRLLGALTEACLSLFDVDAAGLLLGDPDGGGLGPVAHTGTVPSITDVLATLTSDGPAIASLVDGRPVDIGDLSAEARWPAFAEAAADVGARSFTALPMRLGEDVVGAVCLFRVRPGPLPGRTRDTAQAIADAATIGVVHAQRIATYEQLADQLQEALDSRVVLEQAKGMVAGSSGVDVEEAFEAIRRRARSTNQRLAVVARQIVEGEVAPEDLPVSEDDPGGTGGSD